jgi:hypothetical protein
MTVFYHGILVGRYGICEAVCFRSAVRWKRLDYDYERGVRPSSPSCRCIVKEEKEAVHLGMRCASLCAAGIGSHANAFHPSAKQPPPQALPASDCQPRSADGSIRLWRSVNNGLGSLDALKQRHMFVVEVVAVFDDRREACFDIGSRGERCPQTCSIHLVRLVLHLWLT